MYVFGHLSIQQPSVLLSRQRLLNNSAFARTKMISLILETLINDNLIPTTYKDLLLLVKIICTGRFIFFDAKYAS